MLRRARRPLALLAPVLLVSALVASCGSDDDGQPESAKSFDAVSISGDVGSSPEVDWKSMMTAGKPDTKTLEEGDGEALKKGDKVLVNYWVGNGATGTTTEDTFGADEAGFLMAVGTPVQPSPDKLQNTQLLTVRDLASLFISTEIKAGVTRGSRIAITVNSANMFGQGVTMPNIAGPGDIGNDDGMLVVADILDEPVLDAPNGEQMQPKPGMPRLTFDKGSPTGFDFKGVGAPDKELHTTVLKKGTGPEVEKGDILVADYLGQVYQGKKPFDQSFTGDPLSTRIGLGDVVKGWDQALVGQTVGSRVVLQIPPALGYGDQAQGETIPANSTLYFVIDLLAAG